MLIKNTIEEDMRGQSLMGRDMDMELSITAKAGSMWGTGEKTKCMAKEFYTTQLSKLLTKDNGKMINYQDMVHCSIKKSPI